MESTQRSSNGTASSGSSTAISSRPTCGRHSRTLVRRRSSSAPMARLPRRISRPDQRGLGGEDQRNFSHREFGRKLCHMSVFVGRASELAALDEIVRTAKRGNVTAALITGEPGSGKSRLLVEAASHVRMPRQFRVVGYEPEYEVPLASAAGLLRALAEVEPYGQPTRGARVRRGTGRVIAPRAGESLRGRASRAPGRGAIARSRRRPTVGRRPVASPAPLPRARGGGTRGWAGVDRGHAPVGERNLVFRFACAGGACGANPQPGARPAGRRRGARAREGAFPRRRARHGTTTRCDVRRVSVLAGSARPKWRTGGRCRSTRHGAHAGGERRCRGAARAPRRCRGAPCRCRT